MQYDPAIPPGGKGTITLQLRTAHYKGHLRKTARIFTNDPKNPKITIVIQGDLWTPILISNERIQLRGMVGEEIQNTVIVRGQKSEPLKLQKGSNPIPEKIAVQLHRQKEDGSYLVAFQNKLEKEGYYLANITFSTNYPDKPEISIQVMGNVMSNLHARPKVVSFGHISASRLKQMLASGERVMTRPVMVYLTKGGDLEIKRVELEKSLFRVTQEELVPGKRYRLVLKPVLEELSKGENKDVLKIYTNQEQTETLEIPVRFEIMD